VAVQWHTLGIFDEFVQMTMATFRSETTVIFNRIKSPSWTPVPLRLVIGFGFIEHGYSKLLKGPEAFAAILHGLGVPAPHLMAWLTILTELLGGFAVLLGAFVTLVSVPMAVVLLVAMFSVHWRYGFSSIKLVAVTPAGPQFGPPGYECDLLYLACLVALVLSGAGPFSLDGALSRSTVIRRTNYESSHVTKSN
jgi:putative oxidoreductase